MRSPIAAAAEQATNLHLDLCYCYFIAASATVPEVDQSRSTEKENEALPGETGAGFRSV